MPFVMLTKFNYSTQGKSFVNNSLKYNSFLIFKLKNKPSVSAEMYLTL